MAGETVDQADDREVKDAPPLVDDALEPEPKAEAPPVKPAAGKPSTKQGSPADSAWAAMRRAEEKARKLESENVALKKRLEAGLRPEPPDPRSFTDATGAIKPDEWRQAQRVYEDKLHSWREIQREASASAAEPPDDDGLVERASTFSERAVTIREKYSDFDAVVNQPIFTPEVRDALYDSEHGPEIAYFLGKNPTEAARIGALPPAQLNREIGRLEARLSADRRLVSAAPEPITPVGGRATAVEKDPEKMTIDEYMAWEEQRRVERMKRDPFAAP